MSEGEKTPEEKILHDLLGLLDIYAPSYEEKPVADYIIENIGGCLDKSYVDDIYNFIGMKRNLGRPSVIIDAHIDEIPRKESYAGRGSKITGTTVEGSGIDNKAGVAVMMEVAKRLKDYKNASVYYLGTTREEVEAECKYMHYEGAKNALKSLQGADLAIVIDVTPAYENGVSPRVGKGAVLARKNTLKKFGEKTRKMAEVPYMAADVLGLHYQVASYEWKEDLYSTNAFVYLKSGIPTILVSIPVMNMHGKKKKYGKKGMIGEIVDIGDMVDAADLVENMIKHLYGI